MRKNPHHNNGHWIRRPILVDGQLVGYTDHRAPRRRQHGLLTSVVVMPSVVANAAKRCRQYMHAAARNRYDLATL